MAYRGQEQRSRTRESMSQVVARGSAAQQQQGLLRPHLPPIQQMNGPYYDSSLREDHTGYGVQFHSSPYTAAIPPARLPSLSSGQGFYTVESLEGATMLPPASVRPLQMHEVPTSAVGHPVGSSSMYRGFPGRKQGGMNLGLGFRDRERGIRASQGTYEDRGAPLLPSPDGGGSVFGWPILREQARELNFGWDRNRKAQRERGLQRPELHRVSNRGLTNWQPAPQVAPLPKHPASPVPQPARQNPIPSNLPKKKASPSSGGTCWCAICEVECNTPDMLKQHLAGKRHRKHLQRRESDKEEGSRTTSGKEGCHNEDTEQATHYESSGAVTEAVNSGKRSSEGPGQVEAAANKKPRIAEEHHDSSKDKPSDQDQASASADVGATNLGAVSEILPSEANNREINSQAITPSITDAKAVELERDKGTGHIMWEEDLLLSDISEAKNMLLDVSVTAQSETAERVVAQHEHASQQFEKVQPISQVLG